MKDLVKDIGHYVCFALLVAYTVSFYMRWEQIYRASRGHLLTGLLAFVSYIMLMLVVAVASAFTALFAPVALLTTTTWLLYNSWYFYQYPTYAAWLNNPPAPQTFGMDTIVGRFLIAKQGDSPGWFGGHSKVAGVVAAFILVLFFGFWKLVNARADGDRRVAEALQRTQKQSLANRDSVKIVVKAAVQEAVDTITKNQVAVIAKVDSTNRNATDAKMFAYKAAEKADAIGKKASKFNQTAERAIRSSVYPPPALLRPLPPTFSLPTIKPLAPAPPSNRRYRRTGYVGGESDSTYYAQRQY